MRCDGRAHGINRYAAPGVGEAFTARRDDALSSSGFNFHWAGVIMVTGHDRVTFENFARPGTTYDTKNEKWFFQMYGPPTKPGQTFHEQNVGSVGGAGHNTTTLVARTSADPSAHIPGLANLPTTELISRHRSSSDDGEKLALEGEMRNRSLRVWVKVNSTEDWLGADEVYVKVSTSGREVTTGVKDLNDGDEHTFSIALDSLAPITGQIGVKVYDEDVIKDDLMASLTFDTPYTPVSHDGKYTVRVSFPR